MRTLERVGLWTDEVRDVLFAMKDRQRVPGLDENSKQVFRTVWEMPMRDHRHGRRPRSFTDQSQSMNVYMSDPTHHKMTALHMYAWRPTQDGTVLPALARRCDADKVSVPHVVRRVEKKRNPVRTREQKEEHDGTRDRCRMTSYRSLREDGDE